MVLKISLEDAPILRTDCSFLREPKESYYIGDTEDEEVGGEQVLCSDAEEEVTTDTEHYWDNRQYCGSSGNMVGNIEIYVSRDEDIELTYNEEQ